MIRFSQTAPRLNLQGFGAKRFAHDISFNPLKEKISIRAGAGGRSSNNGKIATVFGCTGSLGRYVVSKLARQGTQVVVPYRGEEDAKRHLKVMGDLGQIVPMEFDLRNYEQVVECVRHSDIVVNLIGRFWETRNFTFDDVHNKGAANIARACRENGVDRLIHFSALNADEQSKSEFYASKARGEVSVKSEFPEATIIRPATIYGPEDYFLNRIGITKHFHYIVNNGKRTLYPVNSQDVAVAVDVITQEQLAYNGKVFELAGPDLLQYTEIIEMCSEILKEDIRTINMPASLLTLIAKALKVYPYRVLRPEEVPLMMIDDKLNENTLKFADLGIAPQALEQCILTMMRLYRTNVFYELGYDNDVPRNAKP